MKLIKRNEQGNDNRSLAPRGSSDGIFSLRDAMDRLFDESFWSPFGLMEHTRAGIKEFTPRVDISETNTELKIRADIPGIDPDKLNVEVSDESLTLSGSNERQEEEKGENFYRMERQSGMFSRTFVLPSKIDPDSVIAKAKNGVMTITLKKQPSEQKRKVIVQASE